LKNEKSLSKQCSKKLNEFWYAKVLNLFHVRMIGF
jgi:hypothetical protein